ncbi:MAG: hypothetical protein HKN64_01025 [Woeseiaceae bacterium]|nr:hypothetical protein [Woeseiaceae bacterium]
MLTNKHVVVAMLVAPVLAILGWFAVDYFLSERPHAAKPGALYALIPKSNCRYASGQCDLENGDFELSLQSTGSTSTAIKLTMRSRFPLQQASIGFIDGSPAPRPSKMSPEGDAATHWTATLAAPDGDTPLLGIAVTSRGANYFAEVPTTFLQQER